VWTVAAPAGYIPIVARFSLYWVRTRGQWDDGFVVAKTSRAAATFVRNEAMSPVRDWASAERIAALPEHLQDPSVAVASEDDDPRTVFWASPTVLKACDVKVVHAKSPRVFFRDERLFTEGVLDYLREAYGSTSIPEVFKNRSLAVMLGRDQRPTGR
jgi:hypothetical protein